MPETLADKIRALKPEQQQLVAQLIELLERANMTPRPPRMEWVGKAKDLLPELDTVQIQHEISRWRCEQDS